MKSFTPFILVMLVAVSVIFTGCGKSECQKKCDRLAADRAKHGYRFTSKDMSGCLKACSGTKKSSSLIKSSTSKSKKK